MPDSQTAAELDPLTQTLKRDAALEEMTRLAEAGRPYALVFFDLDNFKSINDTYGLEIGDAYIARAAEVIRKNVREGDTVARYGGEEFVVLLPDTAPEAAFVMMEDLRRTLTDREYHLEGGGREVTRPLPLSGGIAASPRDGTEPQDVLRAADEALYQAKLSGRNRINLATSEKMKMKSSYYTTTQLERLNGLARTTDRSEAFLLREALDDLLLKYDVRPS